MGRGFHEIGGYGPQRDRQRESADRSFHFGSAAFEAGFTPAFAAVVRDQAGEGPDRASRDAHRARLDRHHARRVAQALAASSVRAVAGGGVCDKAALSARTWGVMGIFTASTEARICSRLRPPMIGAVIAGCEPTQATAALIGCHSRALQKATNLAAVSCIHSSP